MPLIVLGTDAYRGELAPLAERGVEYTHIASLATGSTSSPVRAYVKVFPHDYGPGVPARGLVNELVGYFCAERAGQAVPSNAGLILLEFDQLTSPPEWLDPSRPIVGWWSEDAKFPSLRATWNLDALPLASTALAHALSSASDFLSKHRSTPAVVALDDLLANVDRNPGNLLDTSTDLLLIDHGYALTGPSWQVPDLAAEKIYRNVVRELIGARAETLPFKSAVMAEYSSIVSKVSPAMPELKRWLDQLLEPADSNAAHDFILGRFPAGSIARRIGVVA